MDNDEIREEVRKQYGQAVRAVLKQVPASSCCGGAPVENPLGYTDPITRDLYTQDDAASVPKDALAASFGCGNPTALATLRAGETVLDLGSGGGIDVLLSAKRVGPTGKVYGLDMTDEMLDLARKNQRDAGVDNVEFLKGHIEKVPLPDASVDVIISNCVINLSPDKDAVLREAFRVLKPGGRFAVSDVVLTRDLPDGVRRSLELWSGCVAGALLEGDYRAKLQTAGFADIEVEPTRVFGRDDIETIAASSSCCGGGGGPSDVLQGSSRDALDGAVMSAFVRARKP